MEPQFYTSTGQVHALSALGSSHQPWHQNPSQFEIFQFSDLHEPDRASELASLENITEPYVGNDRRMHGNMAHNENLPTSCQHCWSCGSYLDQKRK
jgi:hypothetical protein